MRTLLGLAAPAALAAALAAVIVGCGGRDGGGGGPAGTWVLDGPGMKESLRPKLIAEFEKSKAGLDKLPADQRAMAEKMMPSVDTMIDSAYQRFGEPSMEMTLESGGAISFAGSRGGVKMTGRGTWKLEADRILVTPTEENGRPTSDAERKEIPPLFFRGGQLWMEQDGLSIPFKRK